jgi:hypothetical protein
MVTTFMNKKIPELLKVSREEAYRFLCYAATEYNALRDRLLTDLVLYEPPENYGYDREWGGEQARMLRCLSFGFTPVLNETRRDEGFSNGGEKWFTTKEHDAKRYVWKRPSPHVAVLLGLEVLYQIFRERYLDTAIKLDQLENPHYLLPFHSFCRTLPILIDEVTETYYIPIQLCDNSLGKYLSANLSNEQLRATLNVLQMDAIQATKMFGRVFKLRMNNNKKSPAKNCIYVDANSIVEGEHA